MTSEGTPGTPKDILAPKATPPITPGESKMPTQTDSSFSSFMKGGGGNPNPLMEAGKAPQISPFDLAHGKVPAPGPNFHTLQQQATSAHGTLGDIANQLNTPKLKLKQSTKYPLKNKLSSAKGQIQSASTKLGAPLVDEPDQKAGGGPLQKYLSMITGGQRQLDAAQAHLQQISDGGDQMNPADMLLVQIKLNKAQQQLEYSSMLLSKAVDDMKMLINIQL